MHYRYSITDTQPQWGTHNKIIIGWREGWGGLQGLTAIMQSVGEDSLVLGLIEGKVQQALEAGLQPEMINLKLLLGQVHTLQVLTSASVLQCFSASVLQCFSASVL